MGFLWDLMGFLWDFNGIWWFHGDLMVIQWDLMGYNGIWWWWYLVGGDWNMTFIRFHAVGNVIPIDFHTFQRAWNHQPEDAFVCFFFLFYIASSQFDLDMCFSIFSTQKRSGWSVLPAFSMAFPPINWSKVSKIGSLVFVDQLRWSEIPS